MNLRSLPFLAPLALALLAGACTSQQPDGVSNAASEIHGAGVCAPLAYPHVLSNSDYYRQFDSDQAAGDYLSKIIAEGQLASMSGADAQFKEITTDARLLRLIGDVYEGYKKVFPAETAGLSTPPRVAIVESEIVNAFALGPGFVEDDSHRKDQSPWLFVVHTALMNRGGSDSELRGLFAHELGHLILRNYLPEVRQANRCDYLLPGSEDGIFGEAMMSDPTLEGHVEEMMKRQSRVGGLPELGLPVFAPLGSYPKITDGLLASATPAGGTPSDACVQAKAKEAELQAAQKALVPGASAGNDVPTPPTPEQQANLDQLSQATADAYRACLAPITAPPADFTLMQLTAATNSLSDQSVDPQNPDHGKLVSLMLDAELQADADAASTNLIDRMLRAQAPIRSEFIALRNAPEYPVDQIRVYDFEEDADDAGVRILTAIGDDPVGLGTFLLNALMTPDQKAQCLADVTADRPVPFGRFIDTHPATCWRYYHITQLAKALSVCPAAPATQRRASKGTGHASVADVDPRQLIEKGYGRGQR